MRSLILALAFGVIATTPGTVGPGGLFNMSANGTTCTLNGASPSVCTATVTASAKCQATAVGSAALAWGPAVNLSSTTLTVTGANGASNVVNILCDR